MSILSFAKKKADRKTDQKKAESKKKSVKKVAAPIMKERNKKPRAKSGVVSGVVDIGLQPLLSEKGVYLQEHGFVAFRVRSKASKGQIADAVARKYKVKPLSVKTMHVLPRSRRRGATQGKTAAWKKAYVKVDDVQKINAGP